MDMIIPTIVAFISYSWFFWLGLGALLTVEHYCDKFNF